MDCTLINYQFPKFRKTFQMQIPNDRCNTDRLRGPINEIIDYYVVIIQYLVWSLMDLIFKIIKNNFGRNKFFSQPHSFPNIHVIKKNKFCFSNISSNKVYHSSNGCLVVKCLIRKPYDLTFCTVLNTFWAWLSLFTCILATSNFRLQYRTMYNGG